MLGALRHMLPNSKPLFVEGDAKTAGVNQDALRGNVDDVRRAVSCIRNGGDEFADRREYLKIGYAIRAALPDNEDEALEIFQEWCARWEDGENDPDVVEADWRRMTPEKYRVGAPYLYELAEEHAKDKFDRVELWFDPLPDETDDCAEAAGSKFKLVSFDEAVASALVGSAAPLIKGLLDQGAFSVLYGESNTGKTFVAIDLACHVALGRSWAGMRSEQKAVVYIAAEGGRHIYRRAKAFARRHNVSGLNFHFIPASVDLLRPGVDLKGLIAAIQGLPNVGLVVVDTLSRALAGGDENSSQDMGAFVRNVDKLRVATGAHLMIVHHSGKDRAKGARGHSLLRAATDTEIEITAGAIEVRKQRDLPTEFKASFVLDPVELGADDDGDRVTSCTVRLVSNAEARAGEPTATERAVLDALREVDPGGNWAKATALLPALGEGFAAPNGAEKARAHLKNLRDKRRVEYKKPGLWRLAQPRLVPTDYFSDIQADTPEAENAAVEGVFG